MFKPVEWKSIEGKLFSALSKTFRAAVLRFWIFFNLYLITVLNKR
jgi:hypothetical protein